MNFYIDNIILIKKKALKYKKEKLWVNALKSNNKCLIKLSTKQIKNVLSIIFGK